MTTPSYATLKLLAGRAQCFLLGLVRRDPHKWRRLRKAERAPDAAHGYETKQLRICRRCGATRLAKMRGKRA